MDYVECGFWNGEVWYVILPVWSVCPQQFQALNRTPNSYISSSHSCNTLKTSLSPPFTTTLYSCIHSRDSGTVVGVRSPLSSAGTDTPFPAPCLLQCLFFFCEPVSRSCGELLGNGSQFLRAVVHCNGGSLESARGAEVGARGEKVGI